MGSNTSPPPELQEFADEMAANVAEKLKEHEGHRKKQRATERKEIWAIRVFVLKRQIFGFVKERRSRIK